MELLLDLSLSILKVFMTILYALRYIVKIDYFCALYSLAHS